MYPIRTSIYLNKYEFAKVLGTIALNLSLDTKNTSDVDHLQMARDILIKQEIPIVIRRYLPDGNFEDCDLKNLIIDPTLLN